MRERRFAGKKCISPLEKNTPIIELRRVVKDYEEGGKSLRVLHEVSLSVYPRDFVAIRGASGSGKSTMLHIMGCLDVPTSGEVIVNGEPVSSLSSDGLARVRSSAIGFVFQSFNLLGSLSAVENVELAMSVAGSFPGSRRARALKLLGIVGLASRADHTPAELSGGEKQRVAIARALANEPSILLMDEPTGNLDSKAGDEVMRIISDLWKAKGVTVILITHDERVSSFAHRAFAIRDGYVTEDKVIHRARTAAGAS
jgi:putative ABC transport system ATP-binding protein